MSIYIPPLIRFCTHLVFHALTSTQYNPLCRRMHLACWLLLTLFICTLRHNICFCVSTYHCTYSEFLPIPSYFFHWLHRSMNFQQFVEAMKDIAQFAHCLRRLHMVTNPCHVGEAIHGISWQVASIMKCLCTAFQTGLNSDGGQRDYDKESTCYQTSFGSWGAGTQHSYRLWCPCNVSFSGHRGGGGGSFRE